MQKKTRQPSVSFIIPAYNEEKHIQRTIQSIQENKRLAISEIIVVDNESSDKTPFLARELSAKVITVPGGPIAMLRNKGVLETKGEILVFLDADVSLSSAWHDNIHETFGYLSNNPLTITGSHCDPPETGKNMFERYWFSSFKQSKSSHLGTGHMIMTRKLFDMLNGFSEHLATGEDYDICLRAKLKGGSVTENPMLVVYHNDFPQTVSEFVRREAWHGSGDAATLKSTLRSKVGLIAVVFILLHLAMPATLTLFGFPVFAANIAIVISLMVTVSLVKFHRSPMKFILINSWIYYLYFVGRSLSIIQRWIKPSRTDVTH